MDKTLESRWQQVWGSPSEKVWRKRNQFKDQIYIQVTENVVRETDIVFGDLLWTQVREQVRDQIWDQIEAQCI
jgi:calcineurin-like phosphoesterase family protein